MPTVLLLSTYPIVKARHGGQLRVAQIAQAYERAGWSVMSLAVYEREAYERHSLTTDVPFSADSPYRLYKGKHVPFVVDFLTGAYASARDGGLVDVLHNIPSHLDAVHVEQPWLWPLAKRIKELAQYKDVVLVYGSQNIEAPLKRDILSDYSIEDFGVVDEIDALEKTVAKEADVSIAVTESDAEVLRSWGAKNVILAPNGISPWQAEEDVRKKWMAVLPGVPWLLYVASAHPPNFKGFTQCVGESLGCIPPDSKLVVAGSVCEHLYAHLKHSRWHALNLSRLELLGVLDDSDLAAVKSLAHAFILPIPHGGGSNIKTAEALYSGSYVIGTKAALRGFEDYSNLGGVDVVDSSRDFARAITDVLARKPLSLSSQDTERTLRNSLTWKRRLADIPDFVEAVRNSVGSTT